MKQTVFLKLQMYEEKKVYEKMQSSVVFSDMRKNTENLENKNIELCLTADDYINSRTQCIKLNRIIHEVIVPRHNHDYYEINYLQKGEIYQTVGEENYIFGEGTLLIMHPSVFHSMYMPKGSVGYNILIRKEFIDNLCRVFASKCENNPLERIVGKSSYMIFKGESSDFLENYISKLDQKQKELTGKNGMLSVYSEGLITQLFIDISLAESEKQIDTEYAEVKSANTPGTILQYLKDNYKNVTLEDVSKKFSYSVAQMGRIIKKYTGYTFSSYITSARLSEATFLVINTDKTVSEIAYEVGIHSSEYFCRLYKKQVGLSPLAHRKYARNEFKKK